MHRALHLLLGFLVYVLRLESAKPLLLEFYRALGMDEDAAQNHLDRLFGSVFLTTATCCILAMALGYLISQAYPGTSVGTAGSWLLFAGMVIGAFQFKKRPSRLKLSVKDVREAMER